MRGHTGAGPSPSSRGSGRAPMDTTSSRQNRAGRGLIAASRRALARAGVAVEEVGGYHAHGTGTIQNDRMEAAAFATLFCGRDVTVSAIKGSLGHTLGAAGALDVAVCALMLQRRTVPPVTNLRVLDPLAQLPAAIGATCPLKGDRLLVASAGFGGINAAIVLRTAEAAT